MKWECGYVFKLQKENKREKSYAFPSIERIDMLIYNFSYFSFNWNLLVKMLSAIFLFPLCFTFRTNNEKRNLEINQTKNKEVKLNLLKINRYPFFSDSHHKSLSYKSMCLLHFQ